MSDCVMRAVRPGDERGVYQICLKTGDNGQNAWYDSAGYEADDKCAWHNLYQTTSGGFWVQEFSNGGTITASGFTASYPGTGCVVPNR